ncbi:hypothetical protein NPIL_496701 [Nephila pilipes]|uniref:Mariner Mos1 transposase n=1 Tax=Nephila pilipes TaxID=299642 RepID=A0A8X6PZ98_NEPPI|nr:hypothetical protein NPIL_496701 [Nephila pilipes]
MTIAEFVVKFKNVHHDNAPTHHAKACNEYKTTTGLKPLKHPPYNPDPALCHVALFPHVKVKLKEMLFSNNEDLLRAWDNVSALLPSENCQSWLKVWFQRMEKWIEYRGNYFEKI